MQHCPQAKRVHNAVGALHTPFRSLTFLDHTKQADKATSTTVQSLTIALLAHRVYTLLIRSVAQR